MEEPHDHGAGNCAAIDVALPEDAQREVLDFVEFIKTRNVGQIERQEESAWSALSLASAMKGMEDERSRHTRLTI